MSATSLPVRPSQSSERLLWPRVLAGAAAWVAWSAWLRPAPLAEAWGQMLLLFSPLVLAPLVFRLAGPSGRAGQLAEVLQLPAALLLALAFLWTPGVGAALWSLPWTLVAALACLEGLARIARRGLLPLGELCLDAGLVFLLVGALWASASLARLRPLGFTDDVGLLTGNHFHFAGFVVPVVAGLCARALPGRVSTMTALGVLAGVPLVATGITVTQLKGPTWIEAVAALVMAASGAGVAWLHLRLAARPGPAPARCLWATAGACLVLGMLLAALYGARFWTGSDNWPDFPYLTIPWMRLLHGTLNALGFGLAATLGWRVGGRSAGSV